MVGTPSTDKDWGSTHREQRANWSKWGLIRIIDKIGFGSRFDKHVLDPTKVIS